jgi:hypothetical protein
LRQWTGAAYLRPAEFLKVQVVNSEICLLNYSYHCERPNGYFFRYECEDRADPIRKPEYHMHVILDLPHFVAPPVNLESLLKRCACTS